MSEEANPLPKEIGAPAPQPMHNFAECIGPDGSKQLLIFKRTDLREITQVGFVYLADREIVAKTLGNDIAAAFDLELVTRGAAAKSGENGNG